MNRTRHIVCRVISLFIAVVAIFGNALVCHVIVRLKNMKTSINYIILNLAVLDAIAGFLLIFYVIIHDSQLVFDESLLSLAYNHSSGLAHFVCKVQWIIWLPFYTSPLLLMIMAYERFKAITDPLSRLDGTVTKARLKWMLPLAWLLGMSFIISEIIVMKYDVGANQCDAGLFSWYNHEILVLCSLITLCIVPSTVMLIFYGRVIWVLRKQDNALGTQAQGDRARRKAMKKVMWITAAVTLVFYFCCGLPNAFYTSFVLYGNSLIKFDILDDINPLLFAINSAFNPFVYFLFIQSFRNGFRRVFMKRERIIPPNDGLAMSSRS